MLDSDEEGSRKVPSDVIRNLRRNNSRRNRPRTAFNFSPHSISAKFHLGTIGENVTASSSSVLITKTGFSSG